MFEVHIFEVSATASAQSEGAYLPGDRHAMLAFLRQPKGTEHDLASAAKGVEDAGWSDVTFERVGTLNAESLNGKSEDFRGAFEYAMNGGCGLIIYAEPLGPESDE